MKKEIKFPKGAKLINFDIENGIATAIYDVASVIAAYGLRKSASVFESMDDEEEQEPEEIVKVKPKFEIGWHKNKEFGNCILCRGANDFCGFDRLGEWHDKMFLPIIQRFEKPDMKEVSRLLIDEAEKRGYEGSTLSNGIICEFPLRPWANSVDLVDEVWNIIFDSETGKWADVVEEKKPLYTNSYGREYFEGDTYRYYTFNGKIFGGDTDYIFDGNNFNQYGDLVSDFIGTKKECYQYLADNCKE